MVEIDAIETEATEAAFAGFAEMLGATVFGPAIGAGAIEAALGGDDEAVGIGMKGFGDELFGDVRAVGVGGVDEIDAEFDGAAENANGGGAVGGGPQMPFPVRRMDPKPRRVTGSSPEMLNRPAVVARESDMGASEWCGVGREIIAGEGVNGHRGDRGETADS